MKYIVIFTLGLLLFYFVIGASIVKGYKSMVEKQRNKIIYLLNY